VPGHKTLNINLIYNNLYMNSAEIKEFLKEIELFRELDNPEFEALNRSVSVKLIPKGSFFSRKMLRGQIYF
jgi:hypothetical protein